MYKGKRSRKPSPKTSKLKFNHMAVVPSSLEEFVHRKNNFDREKSFHC